MDKNLIGHTTIALVSLVVAYTAWTSPTAFESTTTKPSILAANLGELKRVVWLERQEMGVAIQVDMTVQSGGGVAVTVDRTRNGENEESKSFPGSEQALELLETLTELTAERSLGSLSEEERAKFGLTEEKAKSLDLYFDGREITVSVGDETFGSGSYYVSPPSGEVFLLPSRNLGPLRHGASVLLDRRALGVEGKDVNRVVLKSGGETRELVHRYPDETDKAFYADPAEPDTRLDQSTAWLGRVLRLRTHSLVDDVPEGPATLEIELFGASDSLAKLQMWSKDIDGRSFARASRFEETLSINAKSMKRILDDVERVMNEKPE